MTETMMTLSPIDAMDAALKGHRVELVDSDGVARPLPVENWLAVGPVDCELLVDPCTGTTIDVGCGPGRLTAALAANGVFAVGIDVSTEAVRRTRIRGVAALRRDVFAPVPAAGLWDHVILADGNIGIGGDPVRLLRRVRQLIGAAGTILVELSPPGIGLVHEQFHFRLDGYATLPFVWSRVGGDAIDLVAAAAGLRVETTSCAAGRYVAILAPSMAAPR
ncbi:MAG: methyltransferase domain-containing protein [Propionibacteriales bacterium]|nr:methyltransferase domain-containing protein [Propionibacteriales bacterium]